MAIRTGVLGYGFTAIRIVQIFCIAVIVAMAARLAAAVNKLGAPSQPPAVSWTVAVCAVFGVWCLGTLFFHLTGRVIRYIITAGVDSVFFVFTIVAAVYLGRPLPGLSCAAVREQNHGITSLAGVYKNLPGSDMNYPDGRLYPSGEKPFPPLPWAGGLDSLNGPGTAAYPDDLARVNVEIGKYAQWVGRVSSYCITMKVAWALSIFLVILTIVTAVMAFMIYRKTQGIPELVDPDDYETAGVGRGRGASKKKSEMRGAGILTGIGIGPGTQIPSAPPTLTNRTASPATTSSTYMPTHEVYNRPIAGTSTANSSEEALAISENEEREKESRRKSSGDVLIPPPPHQLSLSSTTSSLLSPLPRPVQQSTPPVTALSAPHSRNNSKHNNLPEAQTQVQAQPQAQLPYPLFPEDFNRNNTPSPARQPTYQQQQEHNNGSGLPTVSSNTTSNTHQNHQNHHRHQLSASSIRSSSTTTTTNSNNNNNNNNTTNYKTHSPTPSQQEQIRKVMMNSRTQKSTTAHSTTQSISHHSARTQSQSQTRTISSTSSVTTPKAETNTNTTTTTSNGNTLPPKADYYPYTYVSETSNTVSSRASPSPGPTTNPTNPFRRDERFGGAGAGYGHLAGGSGGGGGMRDNNPYNYGR